MSDEVLSQQEVETLLQSMATQGQTATETPPAPQATELVGTRRRVGPREKVTPYDFKRPERVGKEQMRALQTLHEGFGRNFAAGLSAMLRSMVEVKLTSVDQLTYSEFIFSLENPTCFNLLKAPPLEGNIILDINPAVLYPIIDRLLGGGREVGPTARRPLTEIELLLVKRVTNLFLRELKKAWANVVDLEPEVERVESNPQLVAIVPPNEVVVVVSFELTLGDVRGMINLCIPYNALERISNKLTANSWVAYGRREATPETIEQLGHSVRTAPVQVRVRLAKTRITARELIGLRVGDIITTEKDVHSPLIVAVEGVPKFWASPGVFKGRKAIRIIEPIADPSLLVDV